MKPITVYTDREASGGGDFHYVIGSSLVGPGHGRTPEHERNGLLDSWIKYSKPRQERQSHFSPTDLEFAEKHLFHKMMETFGYDK